MRRILLHICASLSLLLCLTSIIFWYRSHHITNPSLKIADSINIRTADPRWWINTHPNHLTLCRQIGRDWDRPLKSFDFLGVNFGGGWGEGSMLWNLVIPFWLLTALFCVLPLCDFILAITKSVRNTKGHCRHCGYDLRASPDRCPECGQPNSAVPRRIDSALAPTI